MQSVPPPNTLVTNRNSVPYSVNSINTGTITPGKNPMFG